VLILLRVSLALYTLSDLSVLNTYISNDPVVDAVSFIPNDEKSEVKSNPQI